MEPLSEDHQATEDAPRQGVLVRPDAAAIANAGDGAFPDELLALVAAFLVSLPNAHTRRAYAADLRLWLAWCASAGLDARAVQRVHLDAYARWLAAEHVPARGRNHGRTGASPTTVKRHLSTLAGFYAYLVDEGYRDSSPATRVKRPPAPDESPSLGLDRTELLAFLAAAEARGKARDVALLSLLGYTGVRISEALGADVTDLATERGHRVLQVTRKNGRRGVVVLPPPAAHALDAYLDGRPNGPLFRTSSGQRMTQFGAYKLVQVTARRAGVSGADVIGPHALRHTFVTLALDAGVPLRDVQDAAGHRSPETTRRYDRARNRLERAATYKLASFLAGDAPARVEGDELEE